MLKEENSEIRSKENKPTSKLKVIFIEFRSWQQNKILRKFECFSFVLGSFEIEISPNFFLFCTCLFFTEKRWKSENEKFEIVAFDVLYW